MRLPTLVALAILFTGLGGYHQELQAHKIGEAVTAAANTFLNSLSEEQRAKATFEFKDAERKNWQFIPMTRKGLPLKEMKPHQQQFAMALLQTTLSHKGFSKALNVMALEQILHEMENNSPRRDPSLYHFFIFGKPSTQKPWGLRVEGHHLSVSFTIIDGGTIVSTPSFFGANPAEVKQGPHQGLRVLAEEEDLGRQLARQLSPEQKKVAIIAKKAPDEVINGPGREASLLEPQGLAAKDMTEKQKKQLRRLIRAYVFKLRPPLATDDMAKIEKAGFDKVHFAWAGPLRKGKGHYYRVQGPSFILEYDSTQNDANHIHCVWRDFKNDFGADLLKRHYEAAHR